MGIILLFFTVTIWALWATRVQNKLHYLVLGVLYVLLIASGYDNGRAGIIADEKGISGCAVGLFGCWGVPIMLALFIITFIYEILLITRYYRKNKRHTS